MGLEFSLNLNLVFLQKYLLAFSLVIYQMIFLQLLYKNTCLSQHEGFHQF